MTMKSVQEGENVHSMTRLQGVQWLQFQHLKPAGSPSQRLAAALVHTFHAKA